jgi:formamidopyrimidine-DNA glycosylase
MPELPEVETIKKDLETTTINKIIISHKIFLERSFYNENNIDINGKITKIRRIGKYLSIIIKDKCMLLIHLRMTGKLIFLNNKNDLLNQNQKHIKVIFYFDDDTLLLFHDVRTFGKIEVLPIKTDINKYKNIGIDALDEAFNEYYFREITVKNRTIKNLLLDQSLIAGIGNIYAQEILFAAQIDPTRRVNTLNKNENKKILKYTKQILKLAILHNGTSISDFRRVDDKTGEFQNFLKVYGKIICPKCKNKLCKIKQNTRTTTYCRNCQK